MTIRNQFNSHLHIIAHETARYRKTGNPLHLAHASRAVDAVASAIEQLKAAGAGAMSTLAIPGTEDRPPR